MPTDELTSQVDDEILGSSPGDQRRSGIIAGLAFVLALAALAISALLWLEEHDFGAEASAELQAQIDRLEGSNSAQAKELSELKSQFDNVAQRDGSVDTEALSSSLARQQALIEEIQKKVDSERSRGESLQQALEAVQARLMFAESTLAANAPTALDAPEELELAGVAYLLRLAPERLVIFHDVRSANEALVLADAQIAVMDNPMYIGVRRNIAEARQALTEIDLPNPVALSADLDNVQRQIESLTFGSESAASAPGPDGSVESAGSELGWWARLKASLAGLVTVRRTANREASRLTLDDKDFLRQALWMQIEGARLALMRHDQATWDDSLSRARSALGRWFDESSAEYRAVYEGLDGLSQLNIAPELPDISGPWAQLQQLRQARPAPLPPEGPE